MFPLANAFNAASLIFLIEGYANGATKLPSGCKEYPSIVCESLFCFTAFVLNFLPISAIVAVSSFHFFILSSTACLIISFNASFCSALPLPMNMAAV